MDRRLFPLSVEFLGQVVEPLIACHHRRPGRPPWTGHDLFPSQLLFVFRTGMSWKDLPSCFRNWHTVDTRFKHVRENGLFWSLLYRLQQTKKIKIDLVWIDSTTVSLHRHGSGVLKKQNPPLNGVERAAALKIHVAFCQGFLCGACLSASNKLDMTVFNELWARGNWDAIVHVADHTLGR